MKTKYILELICIINTYNTYLDDSKDIKDEPLIISYKWFVFILTFFMKMSEEGLTIKKKLFLEMVGKFPYERVA